MTIADKTKSNSKYKAKGNVRQNKRGKSKRYTPVITYSMANSNNCSSFGFASGESTIVTATQQSSTQQSLRKRQRLSSTPGHVELKSRVRQGGDPPFRKGMAYSGNITSGGTEYFGGPVITLHHLCNVYLHYSVSTLAYHTCKRTLLYRLHSMKLTAKTCDRTRGIKLDIVGESQRVDVQ